ncbi:MAG: AAA family ATPase [Leptolyngbya sp.]|nr:MAG: AAA family ATPase [Leptolyngbya sp.]
MTTDPRFDAFCSHQGLDVFHAVTHQHQIWQPDLYDVDTIHPEARLAYEQLLNRADSSAASDSGRILLLLGESGAGKTHLMRFFRNQTHEQQKGFFSYMQMTSAVSNYARYVLRNTIDSFDKPYYEPFGPKTGLIEFSNALAESSGVVTPNELALLKEDDLSQEELIDLIYPIADRVIALSQFNGVDIDVIRALLYLQPGQPAISAKVLKLLRCESLTPYDSKVLGGVVGRDHDDDPLRMLRSFAFLIQAVTGGAFVVCLDQLEDIHSMDEAGQRFRRAVQTIVTLAEIPNVIVVLSCLESFYDLLKQHLPKSHLDRLEQDPTPISLSARRSENEVRQILSRRLQNLYELAEVSVNSDEALYPFPDSIAEKLAGQTTRDVLEWCRRQREKSITTGQLPDLDDTSSGSDNGSKPPEDYELSQHWNDHLAGSFEPPDDDRDLLHLMGNSIQRCGQELGNGCHFTTQIDEDYLTTDLHLEPNATQESLLLSLCQKHARGGALARQIRELQQNAGDRIPVALRTTEFPNNPRTQIAQQIGTFLSQGGRRAQVADSDWRTMLAIQSFEQQYGDRPEYPAWLQAEKPLSQLPSLQRILDLASLKNVAGSASSSQPPPTPPAPQSPAIKPGDNAPEDTPKPILNFEAEPTLPEPASDIPLGQTRSAVPTPVDLPREALVRHAAFLGGSGSGKTTLALTLIEQLLLRGVPAILLDRKGDLCSYANPEAWEQPTNNPRLMAYRQLLRDHIDIAVYTPGTLGNAGRPLSIAITPPGLGELPSAERQQMANYCAAALGGIMGYKAAGLDKTRMAVLGQAIAVLSTLQTDNPLSIDRLISFIAEQDPLLVNAIGVLDPKHCKKLAEDLQTLSLMAGHLFNPQCEQLSTEQLLASSHPQKTRLSVINLGSLGDNASILFWVSQFLLNLNRYAQRHPSGQLQAVVLFDEADLYLPAQGKPSTKEPMESLLKRARSAGLGILLATQSPGDLDYRCRDQISSWFVGKVKENTALNKLKPMLSEAKTDVTSKLANQQVGEFFAIRAGEVTSLKANLSLIRAEQVPLEMVQALAASSVNQ